MLASNGNEIVAVQVKQGGYISQEERNNLVEWAAQFNAVPFVARKKRRRWAINRVKYPEFGRLRHGQSLEGC